MHKQDLCLAFLVSPRLRVAAPNTAMLDRRRGMRDSLYVFSAQLNLPQQYPPF